MRIDLDARVRTRDGEDAGKVERAIVDPDTNQVTDFVISTGGLFGRDVLVPREEMEQATREGDALRLNLTREELKKMPDFVPANYGIPPSMWVPPSAYSYPSAGYLWPASYVYGAAAAPEAYSTEYEESTIIDKGAVVVDRDGEEVGIVEDVYFDSHTGKVTGAVVRVGGALTTMFGGGDTVEISHGMIDRVSEGKIHLAVDKEEIHRLLKSS